MSEENDGPIRRWLTASEVLHAHQRDALARIDERARDYYQRIMEREINPPAFFDEEPARWATEYLQPMGLPRAIAGNFDSSPVSPAPRVNAGEITERQRQEEIHGNRRPRNFIEDRGRLLRRIPRRVFIQEFGMTEREIRDAMVDGLIINNHDNTVEVEIGYLRHLQERARRIPRRTASNINQGNNMNDQPSTPVPINTWPQFDETPIPVSPMPEPKNKLDELTDTLEVFKEPNQIPGIIAKYMEQGFLVPKAKENVNTFISLQTACVEVIMQLAQDRGNYLEIPVREFISTTTKKSSTVRFLSRVPEAHLVFEQWDKTLEKRKREERLTEIRKNALAITQNTLIEQVDTFELPVIKPIVIFRSQISALEANIGILVDQATSFENKLINARQEIRGKTEALKEIYELIKLKGGNLSDNDLMQEMTAYFKTCSGDKFIFEFIGADKATGNIRFIFKRKGGNLVCPDSEMKWFYPHIYVYLEIKKDNQTNNYYYRVDSMASPFLDMSNVFPVNSSERARRNASFSHPHVHYNGDICLGNAATMIQDLCSDIGKAEDILMVIDSLIRNYNPQSPYQGMTENVKHSALWFSSLVGVTHQSTDDFTNDIRNKLRKGEIRLQDFYDLHLDKMSQILRHRLLCLFKSHQGLNLLKTHWLDEDFSMGSYISESTYFDYIHKRGENSTWYEDFSTERPFRRSDESSQYCDLNRKMISIEGLAGDLYRFYASKYRTPFRKKVLREYGPREVHADILECLEIFIPLVKMEIKEFMEAKIKCIEENPTFEYWDIGTSFNMVDDKNFNVWFDTVRKK